MVLLKKVVNQIKRKLKEKERIHQEAQTEMRSMISLSKQTILQIHQRKLAKANKLLRIATETKNRLDVTAKTHPELIYGGFYDAANQEYSEANILLNLIQNNEFLTPEEINVMPVNYVLGLSDVIGEYRRLALDYLREGNVGKGEECLRLMDQIFIELMALDETYMMVPGLRRKNDVARKIIEITRGDITQEVRRKVLEERLMNFQRTKRKRRMN
jgi:translin